MDSGCEAIGLARESLIYRLDGQGYIVRLLERLWVPHGGKRPSITGFGRPGHIPAP